MVTEETFVNLLEKIFINEGYFTARELGVGYGIADLVLVNKNSINVQNCEIRKGYKQNKPLLNEKYFRALRVIPDYKDTLEPVTLDFIIEKTKLSRSYSRIMLDNLEKFGYVKKTENKKYLKVNGWLPIANDVIAIEAKLKNWKRGILQAHRYRSFASKVYLAVPNNIEHLVDKNYIKKLKMGLIILDPNKMTKTIKIEGKKIKPANENSSNLAFEYFWGNRRFLNFAQA